MEKQHFSLIADRRRYGTYFQRHILSVWSAALPRCLRSKTSSDDPTRGRYRLTTLQDRPRTFPDRSTTRQGCPKTSSADPKSATDRLMTFQHRPRTLHDAPQMPPDDLSVVPRRGKIARRHCGSIVVVVFLCDLSLETKTGNNTTNIRKACCFNGEHWFS
jgi:hypothetical protein